MRSFKLFFIITFAILNNQILAQEISKPSRVHHLQILDHHLDSLAKNTILPGFAVAILDKDSIYYSKGFGFANKETQQPFLPTTVQSIASISKTLLAVSHGYPSSVGRR